MNNARAVIDSILGDGKPERVGVTDNPWSDTLRKWTAQGYPVDEKGDPVDPVNHFDFDMAHGRGGFYWKARICDEEILDETEEWKIVRDGNGSAFKWWKSKSGTPEHVAFNMTSRKVWEDEYRSHVVGSADKRVNQEVLKTASETLSRRKREEKSVFFGQRFVWEIMRAAFGDTCLYENLVLDPEWIHDFCRVYTDLYKECYTILFEKAGKPDAVWLYEDLGYKESLFCSPAVCDELIFPYYREIVDFIHSHGLPVVLHTCGYTVPLMDLIVDAGFDALNPMEVKAGNDPLEMARKYGDRLAFIGGLDARVLESGDRDYIEREVSGLVEGMKDVGTRYVFGSDHSLSTNITYEDFLYALDVYREHMRYD